MSIEKFLERWNRWRLRVLLERMDSQCGVLSSYYGFPSEALAIREQLDRIREIVK